MRKINRAAIPSEICKKGTTMKTPTYCIIECNKIYILTAN